MPHRLRILLAVVALCLGAAPALQAQVVRGQVVTGDSTPVTGALVALVDSAGRDAVTAIADEYGRFELRAPRAAAWRLRSEAVGFARVMSFPFAMTAGQVVVRRVQLGQATAALGGIEVRDRARCDVRPTEGTQVARLWDEARKSLAAAQASQAGAPPVAFDYDEIEYDSTFVKVRAASRTTTVGRAERGFRSDEPRALRQLGYARRVDTTETYFAPDARVLLSEDFAATHCFRIVADDPSTVRNVGIGFAPVAQREGTLEVAGTLWLDRQTFALDRVEFRYEPLLGGDFPDSTFGGRVHFSRLPTGHVVVSQWVLRLPIYAEADDGRLARSGQTSQMLIRAERREVVAGVKVVRGAARPFEAAPAPLPAVNAAPRRSVGAPSCPAADARSPAAGDVGGLVRDARGRAVNGARVRASWQQAVATAGRQVFRELWVETGSDPAGRFVLCDLPLGSSITVTASRERARSPRRRLVLAAGQASAPLELALGPSTAAAALPPGVISGILVGADGRPVARADIRVLSGTQRVASDSTGRFRFTAPDTGATEFFVRRIGFVPTMSSVAVAPGDTAEVTLTLQGAPQVLAPVNVEARISSMTLEGFEQRRQAALGGGKFIGPEELRARDMSTIQSVLRSLARVQIEESAMTGDVRMYGRAFALPDSLHSVDRCTVRMMVDGTLLPDFSPLTALPPLREIAAIELYLSIGAVPAMYSWAMPECGLMVVWTRDGGA